MWTQTHKCRHIALKEAEGTQFRRVLHDVPQAIELAGFRVHGPRLQHIQRLGESGGYRSGHQGGGEVRNQVVLEIRRGQQVDLRLVVKCNLANRHQDSTGSRCGGSRKESLESLLAVDPNQSIEGIIVAEIQKISKFKASKMIYPANYYLKD